MEKLYNLPYHELGFAKVDTHRNLRTGTDEVILCANKAKNVAIAIVTTRLFNEVSVQKNQ